MKNKLVDRGRGLFDHGAPDICTGYLTPPLALSKIVVFGEKYSWFIIMLQNYERTLIFDCFFYIRLFY